MLSYKGKVYLIITVLALVGMMGSCQEKEQTTKSAKKPLNKPSKYPLQLGNIDYDSLMDDPSFKLCNSERAVRQCFIFGEKTYEGEMWALEKEIRAQYDLPIMEGQTGLVRIRFIVNCKGEAGRYRMISMNNNYDEFTFDEAITNKLMASTKSLKGWKPLNDRQSQSVDYYQYLIYKIKDGQLIEILP